MLLVAHSGENKEPTEQQMANLVQEVIIKKAEALNNWQTAEAKKRDKAKKISQRLGEKYKTKSKGADSSFKGMFDDFKSPRGS